MGRWNVTDADGTKHEVSAELFELEDGHLTFFLAGLIRAWAPGAWRTVERLTSSEMEDSAIDCGQASGVGAGFVAPREKQWMLLFDGRAVAQFATCPSVDDIRAVMQRRDESPSVIVIADPDGFVRRLTTLESVA